MTIVYTNAQSVIKKVDELRALAAMKTPDLILLTETWTHQDIENDYLHIDGYQITARADRKDTGRGRGGGILVYARKEVNAWEEEVTTDFNQLTTIKIKIRNKIFAVHTVYRSPNSTETNDDDLVKWVRSLRGNYIIIGDFNFPGIKWDVGRSDAKGRSFHDECNNKFLIQHVDEPTHRSGNILDLVLTNDERLVKEVKLEGKLDQSDHEIISVHLYGEVETRTGNDEYRDFYRVKYDQMRTEMSTMRWGEMMGDKDVNGMWHTLKTTLYGMIEKYVPKRKRKGKVKPKWMDGELSKTIEKKRKAWDNFKKKKTEESKTEYKSLEKKTKKMIRNKKNGLERKIAKESKQSPKAFYAYVNSAKRSRSKIGPLKNEDGEVIVDPGQQASILNNFYSSVFTRNEDDPPEKVRREGGNELTEIVIDEERVKKMIDGLKERSAPGPDKIPNKLLKELKNEVAEPLTILYKKCMEDAKIPDEWRDSHITPIFKKGSRTDPGNYRPVNLTSGSCKGLETMVKEDTEKFLETNGLINKSQHGFRRGRSPQTNLIEFQEQTSKWHDDGKAFDIVYFDFSKAFDKVCHKRLLAKLEAIGITGKLKDFIEDWLGGRRQRVVVEGQVSEWMAVLSSVIQGSVLGGTLFNIFIDDIDEVVKAFLRKFADDTKIARVVESDEDAKAMQDDVDRMIDWALKWAMAFNVGKCKVIHGSKKNKRYDYVMNGEPIQSVEKEKDLGVWISEDLKPGLQCEAAAKAANAALGMILRSFHYRKKFTLVHLFKTFVRPKLEFAVASWCPWLEKDIDALEKVQQRAVRAMSDVRGRDYEEKLKDAGLCLLTERRTRGDLIEAFKVIKGMNNVDRDEWFDLTSRETSRPTRANSTIEDGTETRRSNILYELRAKKEMRKNFFTIRVVQKWNELPESVRTAESVNAFKNRYDEWKRKQQNEVE